MELGILTLCITILLNIYVAKSQFSDCGQQSVAPILEQDRKPAPHRRTPRVVGGVESNPHSWPWQAMIYWCDNDECEMVCGGTLVGNQTVVTAAHCVLFGDLPARKLKVRLGAHLLYEKSEGEQNTTVAWYKSLIFVNFDIAVLHLRNPMTFSTAIRPACLPSKDLPVKTTCYVIGWGVYKNYKEPSPVLRQAPQSTLPRKICEKGGFLYDEETEICASWKKGVDSCYGDSGGPLLCIVDNKWELHGIISYGQKLKCGKAPGFYTKVLPYNHFIKENM